jgi:hypothetical protein
MPAMFCPACKAEYRPGFHRCADCDVALVDWLPRDVPPDTAKPGARRLDGFQAIWIGTSENTCVGFCRELQQEGIPYNVAQELKSLSLGMGANFRYTIGVSTADEKRAKELLGLPETVVEQNDYATDEEEDQALDELPEAEYVPEDRHRRTSYFKHWYPEDATVEVLTEPASEFPSGIETAFKENYIRVRIDALDDGSQKYFVFPEDETAAREIVRELQEGTPPR